MGVRSRALLWIPWGRVAIRHERDAREARARASSLHAVGKYTGEELACELEATLVAVTAVANALEAIYGGLLGQAPKVVSPDTMRPDWKKVFVSLDAAFTLPDRATRDWPGAFERLFAEKRNAVVHFKEPEKDLAVHPLGIQTSPEHCEFVVEEAERSVDLLLDVLNSCGASPIRDGALDSYKAEMANNADVLRELRKEISRSPE